MASSTKQALGSALKQMLAVKPIEKIAVKDLVEICGVNRQTFYYHFDDVYDLLEWVFEEDAKKVLPREVVYEHWQDDVILFFSYLRDNRSFALNIYNSNSRTYMLRFYKKRLEDCIRSFAEIVCENRSIDRADFDFVVDLYANIIVGLISQWLDKGMITPPDFTKDRLLAALDGSVENLMDRFARYS